MSFIWDAVVDYFFPLEAEKPRTTEPTSFPPRLVEQELEPFPDGKLHLFNESKPQSIYICASQNSEAEKLIINALRNTIVTIPDLDIYLVVEAGHETRWKRLLSAYRYIRVLNTSSDIESLTQHQQKTGRAAAVVVCSTMVVSCRLQLSYLSANYANNNIAIVTTSQIFGHGSPCLRRSADTTLFFNPKLYRKYLYNPQCLRGAHFQQYIFPQSAFNPDTAIVVDHNALCKARCKEEERKCYYTWRA